MASSPDSSIRLAFHGAARTVTGSKYLLLLNGERTLVDAGLFQGLKELRLLNWRELPFDAASVDRVLLTHTHIDHIGYLPRLVRAGFQGPIYCTPATLDLVPLLLEDSAKLQEEDARFANRKGFSKHRPALPLYTRQDVERTLPLLEAVAYDTWLDAGAHSGLRVRFRNAGHILGSASLELSLETARQRGTLVFSGDIGRYDSPVHPDPSPLGPCDLLVCESTYGDRLHDPTPLEEQLGECLREVIDRRGTILVPAFALGRSQQIAWILRQLMRDGRLPEIPIHIDSPMAVAATRIYSAHLDSDNVDEEILEDGRRRLFHSQVRLHRTVRDSKELNDLPGPRIIISASGMLTGGRVLHHLARLLPERRNLVILAGYQAAGTRGRALLEGALSLKIHGREVPVRCEHVALHGLSGHADRDELLRWSGAPEVRPAHVFLTHGEPEAAQAMALRLRRDRGWPTSVPFLDQEVELGALLPRRSA